MCAATSLILARRSMMIQFGVISVGVLRIGRRNSNYQFSLAAIANRVYWNERFST
jgi:hypothetical protein